MTDYSNDTRSSRSQVPKTGNIRTSLKQQSKNRQLVKPRLFKLSIWDQILNKKNEFRIRKCLVEWECAPAGVLGAVHYLMKPLILKNPSYREFSIEVNEGNGLNQSKTRVLKDTENMKEDVK